MFTRISFVPWIRTQRCMEINVKGRLSMQPDSLISQVHLLKPICSFGIQSTEQTSFNQRKLYSYIYSDLVEIHHVARSHIIFFSAILIC